MDTQKTREYFAKKPEVAAVYLYGSEARGEAKEDSDVDLGVLFKEGADTSLQINGANELSEILGREVEIQNLNICRVDFAHRVISEGKLIYVSDENERVSFETKVLRNYFDLKPSLDEYYKYLSTMAGKGKLYDRFV